MGLQGGLTNGHDDCRVKREAALPEHQRNQDNESANEYYHARSEIARTNMNMSL
jgi:hypothetical protein